MATSRSYKRLRWCRRLLIVSGVLTATVLAAPDLWFIVGIPVGALLALIAFLFAATATLNARDNDESIPCPSRRQRYLHMLVAAAFLIGSVKLCFIGAAMFELLARTAVTEANLRGLHRAIAEYAHDHGIYPPTVMAMQKGGYIGVKETWSVHEPQSELYQEGDYQVHLSFAYHPGIDRPRNDPALVIVNDRGPWSYRNRGLWFRHTRLVLFDDGNVANIDEEAFAAALKRDAQRRQELGWPPAPVNACTQPATRPAG